MEKERMDRETLLRWAVERHAKAVYNLCLGVLRDPADAEDAAQEAFTALVRDADRIRDASSIRPWLLKASLRICWKSAALSRRRTSVEQEALPMRKETQEALPWVREAVDALPEAQRLPLMLRYYQGLEYAEIAEVLDCPEGSVSIRLKEGLAGLKKALPAGLAVLTLASVEEALGAVPQAPVSAGLAAALGKITATSAVAGVATGGVVVAKAKIYASVAALMVLGVAGEAWRRDHARLSTELEEARRAVGKAQTEKANEPVKENAALRTQIVALQAQIVRLETERQSIQASLQTAHSSDLDKVQELADQIAKLDKSSSAATTTKLINQLAAMGEKALPAIQKLLASGKNLRYTTTCEPSKGYGECPTLRVGLLDALRQIGGSEAARIALAALADTQDNLEIYEVSQAVLQSEDSIQPHREQFLAALKKQLVMEPAGLKDQRAKQQEIMRKYEALAQTYGGEKQIPPEAMAAFQKEVALSMAPPEARARLEQLMTKVQSLAQTYGGEDKIPADMQAALKKEGQEIQQAMQARASGASSERLDTYGLELDMIYHLGGVKDLAAELEQAGLRGEGRSRDTLGLLATATEPATALQTLQRIYEARKAQPNAQRYDVLEAVAQIHSPEAHDYIRQIYPGLSARDKGYLIEGFMTGLNMTGGGTSHTDPFVKNFDYRQRMVTGERPVTPAMAESTLKLMQDLESMTPPTDEAWGPVVDQIKRERKHLEQWMQSVQLYRN